MTDLQQLEARSYTRRRSPRSVLKGRIASALCLVPALYLVGVMAFALRNAPDYAGAIPQALRYVVVPGLLVLILATVALKGSRTARVNLGGVACGVLVALFISEWRLEKRYLASVERLMSAPDPDTASLGGGSRGLPASRTVRSLNQKIGTRHLADAVLGGVPYSRVGLCTNSGGAVVYRADRYGFRNPDSAHDRRPNLAIFGDSFVEGICLADGRDFAGQLRRREPLLQSFGTRGAGPLFELALLGRFGPIARPRWSVIVFYEGNDWEDLARESRTPWLAEALAADAHFGDAEFPPEAADGVRRQIDEWYAAGKPDTLGLIHKTHVTRNFLALHQTWTQLGLGYPKAARPDPQFNRIVERAKEIAAGWDGRLALLYVPQTSRFVGLLPDSFVYDQVRDQVSAAAAANAVPFIDVTRAFSSQAHPMTLYADGHFSERGAKLAADLLIRNLKTLDQDRSAL